MSNDPTDLVLQRDAEHLHTLGPRATFEALAEIGDRLGERLTVVTVTSKYRRLTPEMLRVTGGDRFPPRPLRLVPDDNAS